MQDSPESDYDTHDERHQKAEHIPEATVEHERHPYEYQRFRQLVLASDVNPEKPSADYAQQLIGILNRRNTFYGVVIVMLITLLCAASFGAFLVHMKKNEAKEALLQVSQGVDNLIRKEKQQQVLLDTNKKLLADRDAQIIQTKGQLEVYQTQLNNMQKSLSDLKKEQSQSVQKVSVVAQNQIEQLVQKNQETKNALADEKAKNKRLQADLAKLQNKSKALSQVSKQNSKSIKGKDSAYKALKARYDTMVLQMQAAESERDESNAKLQQLQKELTKAERLVQVAKEELGALQRDYDQIRIKKQVN